jgi:serine/threonine protein phosphatase PrpC
MVLCQGYSDKGRKAENQDDVLLCTTYSEVNKCASSVFMGIVADGVSSCLHPKEASNLALLRFRQVFDDHFSKQKSLDFCISDAINEANNALYFDGYGGRTPALLSTFSGVFIQESKATIVHVGDSRVYRYYCASSALSNYVDNNLTGVNQFEQLTVDDSHTKGVHKGALSRVLGHDMSVRAQVIERSLTPGEVYLVMTDGVFEYVSDEEIQLFMNAYLKSPDTLSEKSIAQQICDAAYQGGSRDNLSCLIIYVPEQEIYHKGRIVKKIPPPLKVGQVLDSFTVEKILHENPRSHVYLVTDNNTQQQRVIKAPSVNYSDDVLYLNCFIKEEKVGLSFQHDSVIRFFPKSMNSEYIYHVTEYIEGITLRDYIEKNAPMKLSVVYNLMEKIVISLRVIHRSHLLHQDIKPENIMLTHNGEIKIIDLGSVGSLILHDNDSPPMGALLYTAPDYFNGAKIGIQADVFSLVVITYEMLTGKMPFTLPQLTSQHKILPYTAVNKLIKSSPIWLETIFYRGFSKDVSARYPALSEFLFDLDETNHQESSNELPFILKNPLFFWQFISALLFLLLMICVYFLNK